MSASMRKSSPETKRSKHADSGKEISIFTVDAFTEQPFKGNPAAVCLVEDDMVIHDELMQNIASEMNLSETVFLEKINKDNSFKSGNHFKIRWFTPTNEVALCGHATVASAAVLFYQLGNPSDAITFESMSGDLITRRKDNGICMNFPLNPPDKQNKEDYEDLIKTIAPMENVHSVFYSSTTKKLLVRLVDNLSRKYLESLKPDITSMTSTKTPKDVKGVIVTLQGMPSNASTDKHGSHYDFISRYFAPWNGIPEDPVTGSAHTVLAPYWEKVLEKKQLRARQCSRRGGDVTMEIRDDGRIDLTGSAVIVLSGKLKI